MLERLAVDKHSSLLQKFVKYGRKKFNIGPWPWAQCCKTVFFCNLRMFVVS
jgi:hypothetical protein